MLSQGTSFSFSGTTYTVTRVTVNKGSANNRQRVSTAHLGSSADKEEPYLEIWQPRAGEGGNTVEVDFLGGSVPATGAVGSLVISGGVVLNVTGVTCATSSQTASVGDVIRGSATFNIPT